MIKKLLFTAVFVISGVIILNAQCIPDSSFTNPGLYPDSATNLPHAIATVAYSTTITVVVPVDTFYMGQSAVVDSIGVTGINGLPTGFTYTPSTLNGYWHGGTSGCVLVSAPPPSLQQVGIYPLSVHVIAWASVSGTPIGVLDTITYYRIVIDSTNSGIKNVNMENFNVYQNSPNPFSLRTEIFFTSPVAEIFQFTVYDLLGEVVYKQSVNANTGNNKIEFSATNLTSGIYMYQLNNKAQTITRKMIISGK
jgi:hypothetical protein